MAVLMQTFPFSKEGGNKLEADVGLVFSVQVHIRGFRDLFAEKPTDNP